MAESADFLAAMRDALAERGVRLLVASPPNAATIYQDDLPRWARSNGRTTEYDLFITDLAARGVKAVDLRPTLWTVRTTAPAYFPYETHWAPARRSLVSMLSRKKMDIANGGLTRMPRSLR